MYADLELRNFCITELQKQREQSRVDRLWLKREQAKIDKEHRESVAYSIEAGL